MDWHVPESEIEAVPGQERDELEGEREEERELKESKRDDADEDREESIAARFKKHPEEDQGSVEAKRDDAADERSREPRPARVVKHKDEGRRSARAASEDQNQNNTRNKEDHIPDDFEALKKLLEKQVGLNQSFDVVFREMVFGGHKTGIFYYNGFAKDTVLTMILDRLSDAEIGERQIKGDTTESPIDHQEQGGKGHATVQLFMDAIIPHIQVKQTDKLSEVIDNVSMGASCFFFEGATSAIVVDAKSFPVRSTEEPDLERVVRGARDGFVETLLTNVTLLRRRIRDPKLKLEMLRAGRRTHTDICMAYIDDICDPHLVESIRDKIQQVEVDGLPLAEKQLEEAIVGRGWNPYPMVRYSERPDIVSVHLLEGHVAVFVDTSPSVIILPTTFFHHVQHAEEYRQTPAVGTYLRWVRFIGIAASLFLLPLWFLLVTSPELKPAGFEFLGPQKSGKLPLLVQFLVAELGIDLMRMAAVHTPSPLATAMGLVAAILVGDVAVKTGLFVNEVILYLAIAAVGTFATPSYELSLANRLARLALLILTAVFKIPGLVIGCTALALYLSTRRSYNAPYMWPFIPFNVKALTEILLRRPFLARKNRMSLTQPTDNSRQPK
ncbi:spore germination protein [Paenibacillus sp. NPDC056579]|uniref:spore germination protein n=1 Tax=unclassified Paenibacillus TaxID=185978 RepID=UPI001EF842C1|nr:spore germination protein [Paenibacillus sp. H1-7]ULL19783.1 spore germination protein [Paenibacillus sp. H1-7]